MSKLFQFHMTLYIWKLWKGRKKLQKIEYLKNEKGFLNEMKPFFIFLNAFGDIYKTENASLNFESICHFWKASYTCFWNCSPSKAKACLKFQAFLAGQHI